jgi:hypothetical protein
MGVAADLLLFFFFPSSFPFFVGGGEFCLSQKKISKTFCFVKDFLFFA